jgi:hypothetical protein
MLNDDDVTYSDQEELPVVLLGILNLFSMVLMVDTK